MEKLAMSHIMEGQIVPCNMDGWNREQLNNYIKRGLLLISHAATHLQKYGSHIRTSKCSYQTLKEILQQVKRENYKKSLTSSGETEDQGSHGISSTFDLSPLPPFDVPWLNNMKGWPLEQLTTYIDSIWKLMLSARKKLQLLDVGKSSQAENKIFSQAVEGQHDPCHDNNPNSNESVQNTLSRGPRGIKRVASEGGLLQVESGKKHVKKTAHSQGNQNIPSVSDLQVSNCSKLSSNFLPHKAVRTEKECDKKCLEEIKTGKQFMKNSTNIQDQQNVLIAPVQQISNCSKSTSNFSQPKASTTEKEHNEKCLMEIKTGSYDSIIEEHFQQPLEKDNQNIFSKSPGNNMSVTGERHLENPTQSEENEGVASASGHQSSETEKDCDENCPTEIKRSSHNLDGSENQDKSTQVSIIQGCTDDLQRVEKQESFQVPKGDNSCPSVSVNSTLSVQTCSNNYHESGEQGKSVKVSDDSDKSSSVRSSLGIGIQNINENFTESVPGVAVKTILDSLHSDSSEALVIFKVSKPREKTSLPLKEENSSNTLHENAGRNNHGKEVEVQDSEILWSLFCVRHQLQYSTFNDIEFPKMFPDSGLAQLTAVRNLDPERLAYIVCYGIELYFRMELLCSLKKTEHCVIVFKELFYTAAGCKQIDIYIRFWNLDTSQVEMRYVNSIFIKFHQEENAVERIWECLKSLKDCRIIQFSLDGSAVSLQYLNCLQEKLMKHYSYNLVNINNSLHSIYKAFESGAQASEWKLGDILRSLYMIFKDSPQHCQEYMKITRSLVLPLPFHSPWLILNIDTAERAFEIWGHVKKFLCFIGSEYPSLLKLNDFATLKEACDDVLMPVKLKFFISIGRRIEYLLNLFKSEKPMLPFFYNELKAFQNRCKNYYSGKKYSISDVQTVDKVVDFELNNNTSTILGDTHLGFSGEKILREISRHKVTLIQEAVLKANAQEFILKLNEELSEDPYLNNSLFECLSCLNPLYMISSSEDSSKKFEQLLTIFMETNNLYEDICEELQEQFTVFLADAVLYHKSDFQKFDPADNDCHLDTFLYSYLSDPKFEKLCLFIRGLLLLFNGHVDTTRYALLNEDGDFEEMQVDYIARRFVSDHLKGLDTNFAVTDEMRQVINEALQNHMNLDKTVSESSS